MKRTRVVVPWPEGLHARRAAMLVRVAQRFRAHVRLRCGDKVADLRSILSVLALCASLGTPVEIEAVGEDEKSAADAVEQVFASRDDAPDSRPTSPAARL